MKKGIFNRGLALGVLATALCGTLFSTQANAVTYGSTVSDPTTSAPWAISIWNSPDNDEAHAEFICSGTLIAPHTVLTAAHCTLEPGAYFVKVKSQALNDQTPFTTVSGVWTNPRYDAKTFINDIGLLKLDDDFPGITYPSLANAQFAKSINIKTNFQLFGWGIDQAGQDADLLKSAKLSLQDSQAKKDYGSSFNPNTMISAGRKITIENVWSGACNGDSGGPLTTNINGITVVAGVTSWGEKGCKSPKPTVFSRVSYYYSDIQNGLKSVELKSSVVNRTAPVATTNPQISGNLTTNGTLTCEPGQWKNSVSSTIAWTSPKRLLGTTTPSIRVLTSDAGQLFSCTVIISTKSGTIVRKVLTKQSANAPILIAQPAISGVDLSAPATAGSTLRCDNWNWDGPVDSESIQWFLTSQVNPPAPVNGQLVGTGKSLALDSTLIGQLKGRFITCDITGVRNGFSVDGITSIKLNPLDGPTITSVNVSGSSLALGSSLTCLYNASQNATQVEISWGTSPDGISFNPFPGSTGNVLQINKSVLQLGAGKIVACQVKATNSAGQAQRVGVANSPFPTPPPAPIVSISNSGAVSANSYLSCSAQAGSGYYGSLSYQWGITSAANSTNFIGAALGSSFSLSMNSNYLNQAAGNYLTCLASATNDAGSTSGAASIYVPASVLPLPTPATPVVQSEKTDASSVTEVISIPYFSGFDSTKMNLVMSLTSPTGSCTSSNNINAIPSTITCSGLALSTRYTASLTLSYIGTASSGSTYSQQLSFTTGKSSVPTTPPSVLNYSQSYTGYAPIVPMSGTATSLSASGVDIRFVAQDSAVPVTSGKAQLLSPSGQVIASGVAIFQAGSSQDGAWKVSLSIPSTTPAGTYSVQVAASDGYNTSGWVGLGNLTITAAISDPLPVPAQPQVVSETPQSGSVSEIISVPTFSGFNASSMQLALNIQSPTGGCNNPVISIPSSVTCTLSPNTTYSAVVVVSYQSSQGTGTQSSTALTFTTGSAAPANSIRVVVDPVDASGVTNIGYCFTAPGTLTGTVSTSGTISGPGYSGTQLAGTGAFLAYAGMPSCPSKVGGSAGYRLTPSSIYTFTITATNNGQTFINSATWTTVAVSLQTGLVPTFSAPSNQTTTGFTMQVSNYDASYSWTVSSSAGSASINSSGLISVVGLTANQSATLTVGTSKSGFINGSASSSGTSKAAATPPVISNGNVTPSSLLAGQSITVTYSFTSNPDISNCTETILNSGGAAVLSIAGATLTSGNAYSGTESAFMTVPSGSTAGTYTVNVACRNSAQLANSAYKVGTFVIPQPVSQASVTQTYFTGSVQNRCTPPDCQTVKASFGNVYWEAWTNNATTLSLTATNGTTTLGSPNPADGSNLQQDFDYGNGTKKWYGYIAISPSTPTGNYVATWIVTDSAGISARFSAGTFTVTP